jgi:hypothetical protein
MFVFVPGMEWFWCKNFLDEFMAAERGLGGLECPWRYIAARLQPRLEL